jgi:G:T-mismatch repair DNA endonuclease (very short patch repair protein)
MLDKRICPVCEKEMNKSGIGSHLKYCMPSLTKDQRYLEYAKFIYPELGDKQFVESEYSYMSIPDWNKKYPLVSIIHLCQYLGIKTRSIKESSNIQQIKIKETCLKKYGTTNVLSKNTPIYHKRNNSVKDKYGVDNVFQIQSIKDWIFGDKLYLDKYGLNLHDFNVLRMKKYLSTRTPEEIQIWLEKSILNEKCRKARPGGISKLERKIIAIIIDLGFDIETQFRLKNDNLYRFYDAHIKDTNILLEINGDYWHGNPDIYKETDIIKFRSGLIPVTSLWERDSIKKKLAEEKGFKIIYFWEKDIYLHNNSLKDWIKEKIINGIS